MAPRCVLAAALALLSGGCISEKVQHPFGTSTESSDDAGGVSEGAGAENSSTTGQTLTTPTDSNTWGDGDESESDTEESDTGEDGVTFSDLPEEDRCDMVDFLFVIDNSGSMDEEQANLVASFPGFIDGIQSAIATVESVHVGVITTDPYKGNPPACQQLGSLVTATIGQGDNASLSVCGPYAEGYNFMTGADDLEQTFPCAAAVGTNSWTNEQPLQALMSSLDGFAQSPGQCNAGFGRDEAMLIVTIVLIVVAFAG